jgi:hypothetical protein
MSYKKTLLIVGLATIFFAMSLGSQVYAGGGIDPPAWCTSVGEPTIWGVVVVDCTQDVATVRVKKIENCEVDTFSFTDSEYAGNCPATNTDPVDNGFPVVPFGPVTNAQGVGAVGVIITKAKNIQEDVQTDPAGTSVSFDAQFKYCYPVP